ncbi:MAG TPA: hypothetical protein VMU99_07165 [Acidimicrobiales bacterium]|nr:hypothetical protein [Acidimicrobiales bacterium]
MTRYRCSACGNRTRFDVVSTRRTRAFEHFTLGGECAIEEEEVLDASVESVTCRWCGRANSIEVIEDGNEGISPVDSVSEPGAKVD